MRACVRVLVGKPPESARERRKTRESYEGRLIPQSAERTTEVTHVPQTVLVFSVAVKQKEKRRSKQGDTGGKLTQHRDTHKHTQSEEGATREKVSK